MDYKELNDNELVYLCCENSEEAYNTIINKCKLPHNFFESKPDKGESILIRKDLIKDNIKWYEILLEIEKKCKILVNDELLLKDNITYREFVNTFYNEIKKEKMGLV